jgi:hypothetical protein
VSSFNTAEIGGCVHGTNELKVCRVALPDCSMMTVVTYLWDFYTDFLRKNVNATDDEYVIIRLYMQNACRLA